MWVYHSFFYDRGSSYSCHLTLAVYRAGKDAARAFATGCFKEHQTHDLRGLDEDEQRVSLKQNGSDPQQLFSPLKTFTRASNTGRSFLRITRIIARSDV